MNYRQCNKNGKLSPSYLKTNHQFKVKLEKGSSKGKSHGLPRESVPVWGGKPYLFPPFRTRYHLPIVIKVGSKYVIIEATPKIWKNLIESKRVYLGWKQNVQHSKVETQQLIINADKLDVSIICIQEPYTFMDRACGMTGHKMFYQGDETLTAVATTMPNAILLQQHSNELCTVRLS
ncbi:hypothetical protein BLOT_015695 [Blomia tropicalis]|nr:hypothetical protein BLOT_015695 [Blomia tropicalis]